jgi:thiamine kinase-like enzyme
LIHGDPKFDNFLFKGDKAIAIVDFDTIMLGSRLVDIGDGLRSWCRRDIKRFDIEACREIIVAYNSNVSDKISLREALNSTALITLELAVRFLIDCFEESYFEWDKSKYRNAREHNKIRAIQMIDYYKSIVSFI